MRLNYDRSIPAGSEPLVLRGDGNTRIEIHLRQDADGVVTLLAFAGTGHQPERARSQSPYERLEQAVGARRAIVSHLLSSGYELQPQLHPLWTLAAQRHINIIRERKLKASGDYAFDPKDVFFDW